MVMAVCSIQKNRGRWLLEWVAFHYLVGFRKFYLYLHDCTDDSVLIVRHLEKFFDITSFQVIEGVERPQLAAYKHCYENFGGRHEWIAFLDGDEFLFAPHAQNISDILDKNDDLKADAIGVYWRCFGSSGFLFEPRGRILDNYRYRAPDDFVGNRHFKSLVRGGLGENFKILNNSHFFSTPRGTIDFKLRSLVHGHVAHEPDYNFLIINHYSTQSREFFEKFKQRSGAADGSASLIRTEEWWRDYDRNDIFDFSLDHLRLPLLDVYKTITH